MPDLAKLARGIQWCADNPELHDQSLFAQRDLKRPSCGTRLCLAGAILEQEGYRPHFPQGSQEATSIFRAPSGDMIFKAADVVQDLLDLTRGQAVSLFYLADSVEDLRTIFDLIAGGAQIIDMDDAGEWYEVVPHGSE